jgi:YfiH family protein
VPETSRLLPWAGAGEHGAQVAITTRHGGVSAPPYDTLNLGLHVGDDPASVVANRGRAAAAFGVDLEAMVYARQVHGTAAVTVGPGDAGRGTRHEDDAVAETDILVTRSPAVTVAVLVADCVPIALVDPDARILAAVHAGWRGTAGGAVSCALDAMTALGAKAERVQAYLGPAVAPDRYQVTDAVRDALAHAVGGDDLDPGVARPDGPGHWLVDLVAANAQQLRRAGVPIGSISRAPVDTADPALFSDRAARPCGRFALFARLVP